MLPLPTIEFHGFRGEDMDEATADVAGRVSGMEFADQIVLVRGAGLAVLDLNGQHRPFLRILTRSAERAALLRERLGDFADIEVVFIEFHERAVR
jgi:hypothetical protein